MTATSTVPTDLAEQISGTLARLTGVELPSALLEFNDIMIADELVSILDRIQAASDRLDRLSRSMASVATSTAYTVRGRNRAIITRAERIIVERGNLALARTRLLNLLESQYLPKRYLVQAAGFLG